MDFSENLGSYGIGHLDVLGYNDYISDDFSNSEGVSNNILHYFDLPYSKNGKGNGEGW